MANILVADDDGHIREVVRFALESAGHQVVECADGRAAVAAFERQPVEAVVLDIVMPEMDGLDVCRHIRAATEELPILFLSSRDDELDRVLGLEIGADDYVTKPFSPRELVARVKALLRRSGVGRGERSEPEAALVRGALEVDPQRHRCFFRGKEVSLTTTEFALLQALMAGHDRVYSRAELVDRVWGSGHAITDRTVDSHVRRLRRKFSERGVDLIETVYGVGYRLNEDESVS